MLKLFTPYIEVGILGIYKLKLTDLHVTRSTYMYRYLCVLDIG